jgi:hypothetical protein
LETMEGERVYISTSLYFSKYFMDSATEELAFLNKVIRDSRRSVIDNGLSFIVWGVLVTIGVGAIYIERLNESWSWSGWVWLVTIVSGIIFSIFYGRRRTQSPVQTFAGNLLGRLWSALGISMGLVGFVGSISGMITPMAISPLMACFLAVPYYVSGIVYDLKWFRNLAFGWWVGAIVMFMWDSPHTLGLYCLLMICLQIIPGILLYRRWKNTMSAPPVRALA